MFVKVALGNYGEHRYFALWRLIFFWQTSRLVRPIQTLEAAASKVARGELDIADVPIVSPDEIGTLTQVLTRWSAICVYIAQIQQQTRELSVLNYQPKDNNLDLCRQRRDSTPNRSADRASTGKSIGKYGVTRKNMALDEAMKELQAAQNQLVQSERMNAVGMLTAGVMHEINNPNAAILRRSTRQSKRFRKSMNISLHSG